MRSHSKEFRRHRTVFIFLTLCFFYCCTRCLTCNRYPGWATRRSIYPTGLSRRVDEKREKHSLGEPATTSRDPVTSATWTTLRARDVHWYFAVWITTTRHERNKSVAAGNVERKKRARGARSRRTRDTPGTLYHFTLVDAFFAQLHMVSTETNETRRRSIKTGRCTVVEDVVDCSQSAVFHDPPRHHVSSRCFSVRARLRDVTHVVLSRSARTHTRNASVRAHYVQPASSI